MRISDWSSDVCSSDLFNFADTREYSKVKEFVGYSGLNVALLDGRLRNRFAFTYTNIDRDSYDPDATPVRTFDSRGKNERFEYQGILNITQGIEATFGAERSEEHTSELQSLMRISYAVFCLKKK